MEISRRVRAAITSSINLQYRIELFVASYIDNPSSTLSIAERLQALHANLDYWSLLNIGSSKRVPNPFERYF